MYIFYIYIHVCLYCMLSHKKRFFSIKLKFIFCFSYVMWPVCDQLEFFLTFICKNKYIYAYSYSIPLQHYYLYTNQIVFFLLN